MAEDADKKPAPISFFENHPLMMATLLAIGYGLISRLIFGSTMMSSFLTTLSVAFLCLVPVAIGAVSVLYVSRYEDVKVSRAITIPWLPGLIFLVSTIVFNFEAGICIAMASPLFFAVASIGGLVMRAIVKGSENSNTVNSALVALLIVPYIAGAVEGRAPVVQSIQVVPTQITINAPAEIVWQNIIRVPEIQPNERSVRISHLIGIPQPVEATLTGEGIGGMRHATYDNGLAFVETITEWTPMHSLTFTIDRDTSAPVPAPFEMIGSDVFAVIDGTYVIEPIADNQVILHLSSRHRMSTSFNAYTTLWSDYLMADLQNYLLEIIKARCEAQARAT